jgi:hypothetical protein
MMTEGKGDLLLKTRSFLSFQISHAIIMMAHRNPLGEEGVLAMECQYSNTFYLPDPRQRRISGQDSHKVAAAYILLEKRHSKRI